MTYLILPAGPFLPRLERESGLRYVWLVYRVNSDANGCKFWEHQVDDRWIRGAPPRELRSGVGLSAVDAVAVDAKELREGAFCCHATR